MSFTGLKKLVYVSLMSLMLAAPAYAQTVLKFGTAHPPGNRSAVLGEFHAWAERLNKELTDTSIQVLDSPTVASHGQMFDRIEQGVIDIGFELQSYYLGKFVKTAVSGLPNMFEDASAGSTALWELYESGEIADEYGGYVVLALFLYPNADLMTAKPITADDPVSGRKLAATSAARDQVSAALGASPVSIKIKDWYQAVQRGVIDGMVQSTSAVPPFSLQDVVKQVVKFPLGGNAGMIFMSKAKFDSLSPKTQEIIMKNSGRQFSRVLGERSETLALEGAKLVTDAGGEVRKATPEEAKAYAAAADAVAKEWSATHPKAAALVERYRELSRSAAAEQQ